MPLTNSLPGGFINSWEKVTDELSHHVPWAIRTMYPELDNNYVYAMKWRKIETS